jgi:hypothetical protein
MADLLLTGDAAVRAADVLLRANGGRSVLLRMGAPAVSGAEAEELGLATPEFQDMELAPVVFRKAESTATLLVSASVVAGLVGTLAFDSAQVLFETAVGVVVDDVLFVIEKSVASVAMGEPYCYCLTLRAPVR